VCRRLARQPSFGEFDLLDAFRRNKEGNRLAIQ
jgi:hypothetical protein